MTSDEQRVDRHTWMSTCGRVARLGFKLEERLGICSRQLVSSCRGCRRRRTHHERSGDRVGRGCPSGRCTRTVVGDETVGSPADLLPICRRSTPATEIPPAGVFAVRYQRPTPYLWSRQDITRLLERARAMRPLLKAASYEALFGLLAVSGMRVGEALALEAGDVDLQNGVITIRRETAKLERARLVPLHPSTVEALERYARTRARLCPAPRSDTFFLSSVGTRLDRSAVAKTLRTLTSTLGLRTDTVHPTAHSAQTQLRGQHPDRLAAPRCGDRRADRRALDLSRALCG